MEYLFLYSHKFHRFYFNKLKIFSPSCNLSPLSSFLLLTIASEFRIIIKGYIKLVFILPSAIMNFIKHRLIFSCNFKFTAKQKLQSSRLYKLEPNIFSNIVNKMNLFKFCFLIWILCFFLFLKKKKIRPKFHIQNFFIELSEFIYWYVKRNVLILGGIIDVWVVQNS